MGADQSRKDAGSLEEQDSGGAAEGDQARDNRGLSVQPRRQGRRYCPGDRQGDGEW
jgi:hypothetical protein